jgi:hypothetical protein
MLLKMFAPMDKKNVPRTMSITSPRSVARAASAVFVPSIQGLQSVLLALFFPGSRRKLKGYQRFFRNNKPCHSPALD